MAVIDAPKLNIKEEKARLLKLIKDAKARIEIEIKRYKTSVDNLRAAIREYDKLYTAYVKKPNEKTKAKLDENAEALRVKNSIKEALEERLVTLMNIVSSSVSELVAIYGEESAQAKGEIKNLDKYNADISRRLNQIEGGVSETLPEEIKMKKLGEVTPELECEDEPTVEEKEEVPVSATMQSVKVAPVNIDVTPMIERAISAAISQLSDGLNARIDEYMKKAELPTATAPTSLASAESGAVAELEAHILEGEVEVFEKLRAMCETLDNLITGVAEASGTYITLTQRLKEISDTQKVVNEMQRQTARDQQGVQVSQRLVQDGQSDIVAGQKLVVERQNEVSEITTRIVESQAAVLENEKAIISSQTEIDAALRQLLDRGRTLVTTQSALEDAASKVEATQRSIQERQAEVVRLQRETLQEQRRVEKEQRAIAERQAGSESAKRRTKKKEEAETTLPEETN